MGIEKCQEYALFLKVYDGLSIVLLRVNKNN